MTLEVAVSNANKLLRQAHAEAGHALLRGRDHFVPQPHDADGARVCLHHVDRVAPHVAQHRATLAQVRRDLVDALLAVGEEPIAHHPHARRHELEETCARLARAIRTRLDTAHYSAPNAHRTRVVDGVIRHGSGHEHFSDACCDPTYLNEWLWQMSEDDRARGDHDRARAWLHFARELADARRAADDEHALATVRVEPDPVRVAAPTVRASVDGAVVLEEEEEETPAPQKRRGSRASNV